MSPLKKMDGDFNMPGPGKGGVGFDIKWKKKKMLDVPPPEDISTMKKGKGKSARKRSETMKQYATRRLREMHG